MALFDYVAVDTAGRTVTGAVAATDDAAVRKTLDRKRLVPLSITPSTSASSRVERAPSGKPGRLGSKALALTTRQLATLVSVAPIEEALRTIALQADRPMVRMILETVHGGVMSGGVCRMRWP